MSFDALLGAVDFFWGRAAGAAAAALPELALPGAARRFHQIGFTDLSDVD